MISMDPNIKRYLPYVGVAVALVVGVYFVAGDKLTGEAGLDDPNIAHIGTVNAELLEKLDGLVAKPLLPHVQSEGRGEAQALMKADFESKGHDALATVVYHFRSNGCVMPGSSGEVDLIRRMLNDDTITSLQRRVIAFILVDAAEHAAKDISAEPAQPFTTRPEFSKLVAQADSGDLEKLPEVKPQPDDPDITLDCAMRALSLTAEILQTGVIDAKAIHDKSLSAIRALPKAHPVSPSLMWVSALAANASKQPFGWHAEMLNDTNLADATREMVCRSGVYTGVPVEELTKGLATDKLLETMPVPVQACLVDAGYEPMITAALNSDDIDVRVAAINRVALGTDAPRVKEFLDAAYEPDLSERERYAMLNAVATAVTASKDPEGLLVPIDSLQEAHPESHVARTLASLISRTQESPPELTPVGEDEEAPKVSAAIAAIAKKESPVVVPASLEITAEADDENHLEAVERPDIELEACDYVVEPGVAKEVFKMAQEGSAIRTVCLKAGAYTGPLVLEKVGLRIVALGEAVLEGTVMVKAATALVGVTIKGPVLVAEAARGSMVVACKLEAGALSETSQVLVTATTIGDGQLFRVPGGNITAEADEKPGAWMTSLSAKKIERKSLMQPVDPRWPPQIY